MCCDETEALDLPAEVVAALGHYRRLLDARGWDWGDEQLPDFFRLARFSLLGPVLDELGACGDLAAAVRSVIGDDLPPGLVVVRVDEASGLRADLGPARAAIAGRTTGVDVVVDSAADGELALTVAGREVRVPPRGAAIDTVDVDGADPRFTVVLGDETLRVDAAVRTAAAAELRLSSPRCARWSVTDDSGGAWFPEGVPAKWDVHHRPFFHAREVTLAVPAGSLHVACTRGIGYDRTERDVRPTAGDTVAVECDPPRLFDPAADGWYGGDLHVHMNYSGDLVCTPADAARMQHGEGLHLANLVAGNLGTSLVYDREMLEHLAGVDLPWSGDETVARMGLEYRNDLLGHVHALGPSGPPTRYYAGHERSDHPEDWPPNKVACEEMPGAVLALAVGDRLHLRARAHGPGAEHLTLVGPDGVIARGDAGSELRWDATVDGPTWIAAVVRGGGHPAVLDRSALAHTSPVYVDVAGRRVARAADARWCLDFLDTLERFVDEHGHFDPATRTAHFGDIVAVLDGARSFYRGVHDSADR